MLNLIPKPSSILFDNGDFDLSNLTGIQVRSSNQEVLSLADYLSTQLLHATGWNVQRSNDGKIILELDEDPGLGEEGYELIITSDSVRLCANEPAGLFYAIQTLRQMIPPATSATIRLPES